MTDNGLERQGDEAHKYARIVMSRCTARLMGVGGSGETLPFGHQSAYAASV
jgi:hypothetical protein